MTDFDRLLAQATTAIDSALAGLEDENERAELALRIATHARQRAGASRTKSGRVRNPVVVFQTEGSEPPDFEPPTRPE